MKNISLPLLFIFTISLCSAQTIEFTLADPQPDLIEVYGGSFASGDIDGDGDQDLLMAGQDPGRKTELYLNNGNGVFTEVADIPFLRTSNGVTIFEDLDGDGDLDLFFSGNGFGIGAFAHIYLNDGLGEFTQLANPALPEFLGRGAAIADVDDDGDLDILISAQDANDDFIADVYLNDGNANFTPSANADFTPVKFAAIAFVDVENDGDADVIISGTQSGDTALTTLYLNDGSGNFSMDTNTNFEQLSADDVDVADTDNDGDLDILMSGLTDASGVRTILYINDGNGTFNELAAGLQETFAGTNAIADLDNDGDQDFVIIGSQEGGLPNIFNIVYENLGNNEFVEADILGGEYIAACVVDDFNGDGLVDIIIQGFVDNTNFYWNSTPILSNPDVQPDVQATLYPNPAKSTVQISSSEEIQFATIYSALGQIVFTSEEDSNHIELDISLLQAGNYFVQLRSQGNIETMKLIKI